MRFEEEMMIYLECFYSSMVSETKKMDMRSFIVKDMFHEFQPKMETEVKDQTVIMRLSRKAAQNFCYVVLYGKDIVGYIDTVDKNRKMYRAFKL